MRILLAVLQIMCISYGTCWKNLLNHQDDEHFLYSHDLYNVSLHSRRKRERGRGARTREKNGVLGARDEGTPATKTPFFHLRPPIFR